MHHSVSTGSAGHSVLHFSSEPNAGIMTISVFKLSFNKNRSRKGCRWPVLAVCSADEFVKQTLNKKGKQTKTLIIYCQFRVERANSMVIGYSTDKHISLLAVWRSMRASSLGTVYGEHLFRRSYTQAEREREREP